MDPEGREQERSTSYAGLVRAVWQAFETMSEHPSSCLTNSTNMTLNGEAVKESLEETRLFLTQDRIWLYLNLVQIPSVLAL